MNMTGLIFAAGGVYMTLIAYRVIPKKPKDPEKFEQWYKKFGPFMKIAAPIVAIFGILELLNIF